MTVQAIKSLARISPLLLRGSWDPADLTELGVESGQLSGAEWNAELVQADLAANDSIWRLLSLIDPFRSEVEPKYQFATIYAELRVILAQRYYLPPDEADELAKPISGFLTDLVFRMNNRKRVQIASSLRAQLVEMNRRVRCWYCGAEFSQSIVDLFLNSRAQGPFVLPRYVDFVTSRGAVARDLNLEVDHVVPIASGGESDVSNLRISCGWCNRNKRQLTSLYDTNAMPLVYQHPRAGKLLVPAPYWVIRVLGTRRRCEWPAGCRARIESEQMFCAPRSPSGAMAPGNLGAFCQEHDPLEGLRLVPNPSFDF